MNHELLLESWDRQCNIINNLANLVDDNNKFAKPNDIGWPLYHQLCHIQMVRKYWLSESSPAHSESLGNLFSVVEEEWTPTEDLNEIKKHLTLSEQAIRTATKEAIENDVKKFGPYDHPTFFLQHMIWHEGYHAALIMHALINSGNAPSEEWEEINIWSQWRDSEII